MGMEVKTQHQKAVNGFSPSKREDVIRKARLHEGRLNIKATDQRLPNGYFKSTLCSP